MLIPQHQVLVLKLSPIYTVSLPRYFQFPKISVIRAPPVVHCKSTLNPFLRCKICIQLAFNPYLASFMKAQQKVLCTILRNLRTKISKVLYGIKVTYNQVSRLNIRNQLRKDTQQSWYLKTGWVKRSQFYIQKN